MKVILFIYIVPVIITAITGIISLFVYSDEGRDSIEVQSGITMLKFAIIFPLAWYKTIKAKLNEADDIKARFEEAEREKNK